MATQPDFWGDIGISEIRSPVAILREQAALLGSKTKNLVEAKVETRTAYGDRFTLGLPRLVRQTVKTLVTV